MTRFYVHCVLGLPVALFNVRLCAVLIGFVVLTRFIAYWCLWLRVRGKYG